VKAAIVRLRRRADNVAVGLLTAMFLTFLIQIGSRYVFNARSAGRSKLCLTLLAVGGVLGRGLQRRGPRPRQVRPVLSRGLEEGPAHSRACLGRCHRGRLCSRLCRDLDYITFYDIKKSATLRIRLDIVFSVYGVFAVAIIARYTLRAVSLARGADPDPRYRRTTGEAADMSFAFAACLIALFALAGIGAPIALSMIVAAVVYLAPRARTSGLPPSRSSRASTTASSSWRCRCSSSPPTS
jgi:C4-dicarboxylate transporter, DctQ subunit